MEKILLVEDNESLGRGIEFALQKEGWEVHIATTLQEGQDLLKNHTFNLVLLDVMLPDGSGFDLCKSIRRTSDVPVIFLTACDEEVNVVLGLDIGADDYITKPFRVRELVSRIRATLRRYSGDNNKHSEKMIRSEDIILYPLEHKVLKKEEEILLTPAEYKLILILLQNAKTVLSRDKIVEKLWDIEGSFIDDNTLSVYIRRLREKIEDNPRKPEYILTVRGVGYKWDKERG